jgi:hypothetical protein
MDRAHRRSPQLIKARWRVADDSKMASRANRGSGDLSCPLMNVGYGSKSRLSGMSTCGAKRSFIRKQHLVIDKE